MRSDRQDPNSAKYMELINVEDTKAADICRYMNFDQINEFTEIADTVAV